MKGNSLKNKRILFLLPILFFFLFGCSASKPQKKNGKTTLTWAVGKDVSKVHRELIKRFELLNPSIHVKLMELTDNATELHGLYATFLNGKESEVDVYAIDVIWPPEFAAAGWIQDLSALANSMDKNAFLPGPMEACRYQEKLFAIPWFTDAGLLYYRKDLLREAGLKIPKKWPELINDIKIIKKKHPSMTGYAFQAARYEGMICDFLEILWAKGGSVLQGNKTITVNRPEFLEALRFFSSLVQNQNISPVGIRSFREEDARRLFTSGKAIFMRNWPYAWTISQNPKSKVKGKVGITTLPAFDGRPSASALGGWNLAISSFSKHPKAAMRFIRFLTSKDGQQIDSLIGGKLPTRKALYKDPVLLEKNPFYKDLYPIFLSARPRPRTPVYSEISDAMQVEIHKTLSQIQSPEQALPKLQKNLKRIISSF